MKYVSLTIVVFILGFIVGYIYHNPKPQIIEKEKTIVKTIKDTVYVKIPVPKKWVVRDTIYVVKEKLKIKTEYVTRKGLVVSYNRWNPRTLNIERVPLIIKNPSFLYPYVSVGYSIINNQPTVRLGLMYNYRYKFGVGVEGGIDFVGVNVWYRLR